MILGHISTLDGEITLSREGTEEVLETIAEPAAFSFLHPVARRHADGIYFDYERGKFYDLVEDSKALVDILAEVGVTVAGIIEVTGEDNHDIWRLVFSPGKVEEEKIEMRWPDGTVYRG